LSRAVDIIFDAILLILVLLIGFIGYAAVVTTFYGDDLFGFGTLQEKSSIMPAAVEKDLYNDADSLGQKLMTNAHISLMPLVDTNYGASRQITFNADGSGSLSTISYTPSVEEKGNLISQGVAAVGSNMYTSFYHLNLISPGVASFSGNIVRVQ
jgi:hypothetical protein